MVDEGRMATLQILVADNCPVALQDRHRNAGLGTISLAAMVNLMKLPKRRGAALMGSSLGCESGSSEPPSLPTQKHYLYQAPSLGGLATRWPTNPRPNSTSTELLYSITSG